MRGRVDEFDTPILTVIIIPILIGVGVEYASHPVSYHHTMRSAVTRLPAFMGQSSSALQTQTTNKAKALDYEYVQLYSSSSCVRIFRPQRFIDPIIEIRTLELRNLVSIYVPSSPRKFS